MKFIYVILLSLCVQFGYSQTIVTIKGPVVFSGLTYNLGDKITIGSATGKNDSYRYIFRPYNHITNEDELYLPSDLKGQEFKIKKFKEGDWQARGFRKFLIIEYKKRDFIIDADLAFSSGEIISQNQK